MSLVMRAFEQLSEGQGVPVCIPNEALMPSIVMKRTTGASPGGAGLFLGSPIAHTTMSRAAVLRNWEMLRTCGQDRPWRN